MDRLLMPGVAFDLSNPNMAIPLLTNLKRIAGITTYGRPWWNALLVGNPPKKIMTRYMPRFTAGKRQGRLLPALSHERRDRRDAQGIHR